MLTRTISSTRMSGICRYWLLSGLYGGRYKFATCVIAKTFHAEVDGILKGRPINPVNADKAKKDNPDWCFTAEVCFYLLYFVGISV